MLEKLEISKQPEKIPDHEFGNLVAAVGNNEAKALTLLAMKPGRIYISPDIYKDLMEMQGKNPGWRIARLVPFQYCRDSLHPIGLVAMEVSRSDTSVLGYAITEYGQEIGVPLAGLLLDFSLRYPEFSLYDIFGNTNIGGADEKISKRAPVTRMQILWELATTDKKEGKLRIIDLVKSLGKKQDVGNVGEHLKQMARRGIISFDSKGTTNEPYTLYHLNDKQPDSLTTLNERQPVMTKRVYEAMLSGPEKLWTRGEIVDAIIKKYPELYFSRQSIYDNIVSVLKTLRNTQIVHFEKFHNVMQSEAYLTTEQRGAVVELLEILDNVQNKNRQALKRGKELAAFFLNSPAQVAGLMQKTKEHSRIANASRTETLNEILQILRERPYITASDIEKGLEENGRFITAAAVRKYMNDLVEDMTHDDRVKFKEEKGVRYWYLFSAEKVESSGAEFIQRIDQVAFPESEKERCMAIQNAFIYGHVAKTYLLLLLNGEIGYKLEMYRRSKAFTKESDVNNGAFKTFIYNADHVLYPNGLIAKEFKISPLGYERHSGYGLSEAGRLYGNPAAVLGVNFENEHGYTLESVLGHARSSDSSGLYDRSRILTYLAGKEEGASFSEIMQEVEGYNKLIKWYLKVLKNGGAIESLNNGKERLSEKGKIVVKEYLEPLFKLLHNDQETRVYIMEQLLPKVMEMINPEKESSASAAPLH